MLLLLLICYHQYYHFCVLPCRLPYNIDVPLGECKIVCKRQLILPNGCISKALLTTYGEGITLQELLSASFPYYYDNHKGRHRPNILTRAVTKKCMSKPPLISHQVNCS